MKIKDLYIWVKDNWCQVPIGDIFNWDDVKARFAKMGYTNLETEIVSPVERRIHQVTNPYKGELVGVAYLMEE